MRRQGSLPQADSDDQPPPPKEKHRLQASSSPVPPLVLGNTQFLGNFYCNKKHQHPKLGEGAERGCLAGRGGAGEQLLQAPLDFLQAPVGPL